MGAREEEELIMRMREIPADSSNSEPGSCGKNENGDDHHHDDELHEDHDANPLGEGPIARPPASPSTMPAPTSSSVPQFSESLGRAQYPYPRSSDEQLQEPKVEGLG